MKRSLIEAVMLHHPEMDEREARGRILRGDVTVDGDRLTKPGAPVTAEATIVLRARPRFVSRGGDKLDGALTVLGLDVRDRVMVDAGCSTGGFTDCLLQRGVSAVHAVDVGKGQLAWRLRRDWRVHAREGTNIMSLVPGDLDPSPAAAVCDLSFRSIRGAAGHLMRLVGGTWVLALVKPQFEWSECPPVFDGVVRDPAQVDAILEEVVRDLGREGLSVAARCPSQVPGRKGNREYFYLIRPA